VVSDAKEPRQASLRRLRAYGVRPDRDLGQNFLVDDNVLRVIERAAELDPADVVLEVGGGLGVLSEHLAGRVAHVHVVEVDERLRAPLEEALAPFPGSTLHFVDAVKLDYGALDPPPGKVVANLPYGVAARVILDSIAQLPDATLWVAMVQREVGERLAAGPGSRAYGATSAIAQLSCDVELVRRVPASVFTPRPRVESAIVRLRRRPGAGLPDATRALIHAAFAHRRKALSGSLALQPGVAAGVRERARAAVAQLGHPPDVRAERLSPQDFERLASMLEPADIPGAGAGA
jgi:16S rRNA (adenine1518-N6/adenine1519-N6)-dimethyltransferase